MAIADLLEPQRLMLSSSATSKKRALEHLSELMASAARVFLPAMCSIRYWCAKGWAAPDLVTELLSRMLATKAPPMPLAHSCVSMSQSILMRWTVNLSISYSAYLFQKTAPTSTFKFWLNLQSCLAIKNYDPH